VGEEHAVALDAHAPRRDAAEPEGVPEPRPFGPEDVAPRFRGDLRVARGSSAAFFDVTDPATGRTFTLYEFELAIARMLDGRRSVAQVIASGERLGIPIDVRSLHQFVRQMWQYGFLAPPGAAPAPRSAGSTWGARERWDDETRALFQGGQRLMRLGRNAEAAAYFEAMLDANPANAEAQEMLALIARGHSLAVGRTLDGAAEAWPVPPARAPLHRHPAVIAGAVVGVALLGLGAIALLSPFGPAERAALSPPSATSGTAAPGLPAPPAAVARTLPVERRAHPPVADVVAPAAGELVWGRAPDAPVTRGERLGAVRAAGAAGAEEERLARRVAELERLAAQDPIYGEFLERARRDLRDAAGRRPPRIVAVVAPAAGLLARAARPGGHAALGERLARIVDPAVWHLAAVPGEGDAPVEPACEVVGDTAAERAPCRVVGRVRAGARTELLVEVGAADAPWVGTTGTLWLRLVPAPPPAPPGAASPDGRAP
jgi:hypothetical protein